MAPNNESNRISLSHDLPDASESLTFKHGRVRQEREEASISWLNSYTSGLQSSPPAQAKQKPDSKADEDPDDMEELWKKLRASEAAKKSSLPPQTDRPKLRDEAVS